MAGAWDHHPHPPAVDNAYDYYIGFTQHYLHHPMPVYIHYPMQVYTHHSPMQVTAENVARFTNFHNGYMIYSFQVPVENSQMYFHYGSSPRYTYGQDQLNHPGLVGGAETYVGSWIQAQEEDEALMSVVADQNTIWEDPWIHTLNEEELLIWNLLDQDAEDFSSTDGLSEDTITKHLKTRIVSFNTAAEDEICVVCLDCLFQEEGKVANLECGHEYHAGCIKNWLMRKNCCPLCQATVIPVN